MSGNILKKVKMYISENQFDIAEQMISTYEKKIPSDYDLLIVKTLLYIKRNDFDNACKFAKQAVEKNRLNLDANYNMAFVYEKQGEWLESYTYYSYLFALQEKFKEEVLGKEELLSYIDNIILKMAEHLKGLTGEEYQKYYTDMNSVNQVETDLLLNMFHSMEDMDYFFGKHHINNSNYFFARYDDWFHSYWKPDKAMNATESKVEIFKVREYGTEYTYDEAVPCIVPCILNIDSAKNKIDIINKKGEKSCINETIKNTCSYLKLDGKTLIKAENPMAFGEPVLLKQSKHLKKLVLTIFVDSLNVKFFNDHPLKEVMPYTYKFFGAGVSCTNAYCGSEFTYPSVSSYWTGMRSNHHKMLNSKVNFDIPHDIKLLSEYFKEAGYYTSKIGGNYSVVPNYGYIRGTDRFVFQRWAQNFNVQQAVCEAVEHIETYKGTNQFVWLDIGDLHDVAGGWQRSSSVQVKASYSSREIDNSGGSTLFQTFSPNKREIYKEELKHVDMYLNMLYQYIEQNYGKDEVVISFISDHGNGFNVSNGQPFLSDQRMNVPMMFYSDFQGEHECKEIVESIDYASILCKMAGVEMHPDRMIDGQVPAFFGGDKKKEYAIAQSIFPNEPYSIGIFNEQNKFYLVTENNTANDCRIDFSKTKYMLVDKEDKSIEDEATVRKYLDMTSEMIQDFNLYN